MKRMIIAFFILCIAALMFAGAQYTGAFFKIPSIQSGTVITPKINAGMYTHFLFTSSIVYDGNTCYVFVVLPATENQMFLAIMYGLQGLTDTEQVKYSTNIAKLNTDVFNANNPKPIVVPTPTAVVSR